MSAEPREFAYLAWSSYILNLPSIPQTISTSYGNNEKDYSKDYALFVSCSLARVALAASFRAVTTALAQGTV